MGKRKRKEKDTDDLYRKMRRIERQLDRQTKDRYNRYYCDDDKHDNESISSETSYIPSRDEYYSDSDLSEVDRPLIPSAVSVPECNTGVSGQTNSTPSTSQGVQTAPVVAETNNESQVKENQVPVLPPDILEALGQSKEKDEVLGPKIREEISQRWSKIITEGLSKESRQNLLESVLIPENFQLLKAPKLNPEILAVCSDPGKKRDKHLEKVQNHLGVGIASLTTLMSNLTERDMEKTDIIKKLSETGQILLDLHFQNTLSRRKLTSYCLGKNFSNIVANVKRDSFLFGENLGEKIKASKTAERSGLQIKATEPQPSTSHYRPNRNARQGNFRGPPKQKTQRQTGGQRSRYSTQTPRPQRTTTDRYPSKGNPPNKSTRKTN